VLLPRWSVSYRCLHHLLETRTPGSIGDVLVKTDDTAYFAWNLAALAPWMPIQDPPDPRRKANALPPVAVVAREGFKAPNKLSDVIASSQRNRDEILKLKRAVDDKASFIHERDTLGMAIRRWDSQGGSWKLQVLSALLTDAAESLEVWTAPKGPHGQVPAQQAAFIQSWQAFMDHLVELDVVDAPNLKRLLDGRALAQALGTKPGRWTGKALDICTEWQLRNPQETDPKGAIEEVRKRSEELGIVLQ
jgi:tRNA nucleotidyltransferase (CCA-adding enzyme)